MNSWNDADLDDADIYDHRKVNFHEIGRALDVLLPKKGVVEVRALGVDRGGTVSGYFDVRHRDDLLHSAAELSGVASGVYETLNPVNPDLLARSSNRCKKYARHTTSDQDITCRRWILLDFDPMRPSGISATDAEHTAAIDRAREVYEWLRAIKFPQRSVVLADSGNGAHVLVRCSLPNDAESTELVRAVIGAVAIRFSDEKVDVDLKTYNPARISKIYGTLSCKGDDVPDRSHRIAGLLDVPDDILPPKRKHLERLAAMAPTPAVAANSSRPSPPCNFDLTQWIEEHELPVCSDNAWQGGHIWILNPCPWNAAHTDRSAFLIQHASGAISASCHHNGCTGKGWHDLRDVVEPEWRDQRQVKREIELPESVPENLKREFRKAVGRRQRRRQ
jgi:hypothetical protein